MQLATTTRFHLQAVTVALVLALAGCGSSSPKPKTPIAAFNDCLTASPVSLSTSNPPTKKVLELISSPSDNNRAIGTVFLTASHRQAEQLAQGVRYNSQLTVARGRYTVSVYNDLPRRYATAVAACLGKLS
jgi:hypothetical protein